MTIDTALSYEMTGEGPDILLLHGFASSSRMWDVLVAGLHRSARFWALDFYGHGASPIAPNGRKHDIDLHVESAIDFCDSHGLRPRAVMGHSMGGLVTLKLALSRPDLAERLVLLCPAVTGQVGFGLNQMFRSSQKQRLARGFGWGMRAAQTELVAAFSTLRPSVDPRARDRVQRDFQRLRVPAAMESLESLCESQVTDELARITQPALIMTGTRDYTLSPRNARLAAEQMPNARLIEFPEGYHQPLDEQPGLVIDEIRRFTLEMHTS